MIPPSDAPTDDVATDAREVEDPFAALFAASRARMLAGPARAGGGVLLFVTLVLFVLSAGRGATPGSVAILVGVLLVHELGHYIGMRAFGYRDVRMFFVPFFGAAVSGRRGNVAAWKDAVVLLLGPVPGVFLGTAILIATWRWPRQVLVDLGQMLLLINAFNLLPFGALDGGKLLLRVLFARHRYLELAFTGFGALMLGLVALGLGSVALGIFAVFGLVALGRRSRILEAASSLRPVVGDASASSLDDVAARKLFDGARAALVAPASSDPNAIGMAMEDVLLATQRAPGFIASTLLAGTWAVTCAVALVTGIVLAHATAPADWQRHAMGAYSVEMPDEPALVEEPWSTPVGSRTASLEHTSLSIVEHFTVTQVDAGSEIVEADRAAWVTAMRTELLHELEPLSPSVVSEQEVSFGGRPCTDITLSNGWRVWRVRMVVAEQSAFTLVASAPEDGADATRFLDSFEITPVM